MSFDFGILKYRELAEIATGPTPYLLENFIPERSIGVLVGEWGIGKSPFAIQLQMSLAAGLPFLGRYRPREEPIKTLYVDLENGAQPVFGIASSIAAFLRMPEPPENWYAYSPNYCTKPKELSHLPEDVYVRELLRREHFDFIIIDPLRMFKPDAESKNSEAAAMIRTLRGLIAEANCSIMFIHHPRKPSGDAEAIRFKLDDNPTEWMANACGAASLIQNSDFRIGLEQTEDGLIVCRRFLRNRGWYPSEYIDRAFDAEGEDPIGYILETGESTLKPLERQWLRGLSHQFTTGELKEVSGKKHNQTINNLLTRWVSLLVVQKAGRGLWSKI